MDEITTVKNSVKYAEWFSMVEASQNSGLSVRTWCQENSIGYKTYYYRLRKLREKVLDHQKSELVPEIQPLPVIQEPHTITSPITIRAEGISVDIPQGTDKLKKLK